MQLKRIPTSRLWFLAALVLLALFGIFTIIFSTGVLLYPTLHIEQWLLHRPLTAIDCVFVEWKQLGEVGASLLGTLVLGGVCVLLGYRRRMLPFLFLLLLLGVGVEYGGKQYFPQVVPANTQFGMNSLACPQMWRQSRSTKIMVALGMWWKAPPARPVRIRNEQFSATAPLIIDDNARLAYGYPSGHAMRWFFMGFVAFSPLVDGNSPCRGLRWRVCAILHWRASLNRSYRWLPPWSQSSLLCYWPLTIE